MKVSNQCTNNYYSNSLYCANELLVFAEAKDAVTHFNPTHLFVGWHEHGLQAVYPAKRAALAL